MKVLSQLKMWFEIKAMGKNCDPGPERAVLWVMSVLIAMIFQTQYSAYIDWNPKDYKE